MSMQSPDLKLALSTSFSVWKVGPSWEAFVETSSKQEELPGVFLDTKDLSLTSWAIRAWLATGYGWEQRSHSAQHSPGGIKHSVLSAGLLTQISSKGSEIHEDWPEWWMRWDIYLLMRGWGHRLANNREEKALGFDGRTKSVLGISEWYQVERSRVQ